MSDKTNKGSTKLGSNPLGGGALDWLDDEPAPPVPQPRRKETAERPKTSSTKAAPKADADAGADKPGQEGAGHAETGAGAANRNDSTRRGVAAGYRRHTLLMREDQIEQLNRLHALEKLHAGEQARTKKDIVEAAFDLFFQSESSEPRSTN